MRDAASWADDEITLAKIYGIDVEELQQMQHAAKIVDVDIDTIVKARQKLMQAMGKELDSKDITEAFQALRVPVYDENGNMRKMETVFWEAGRALMELDDEVMQNNIAMKLFGKSWMDLRPLFLAGSDTYKKAMEEATVVPQENIEKLGALQDQLDRLDDQFQTLKMNVLSELAPSFEVLAKSLSDLMAEFNAYLQTDDGKALMDSLREAMTAFFTEISKVDLQQAVSAVMGSGARGPLTHIHLGRRAVVVVVIVLMVHEPPRRFVVMLVDHVNHVLVLLREVPAFDIVGRRIMERPHRAANGDLRMAFLDGAADHLATLLEDGGDDVFVAYADVFQVERSGMSGIGSHLRPFVGGRIGVRPLYQVAKLIDVGRNR